MEEPKESILIIDDDNTIIRCLTCFITTILNVKGKVFEIIPFNLKERGNSENNLVRKDLLNKIKKELKNGLKYLILDGGFLDELYVLIEEGRNLSVREFDGKQIYICSGYDEKYHEKEMKVLRKIGLDITFFQKTDMGAVIKDIATK